MTSIYSSNDTIHAYALRQQTLPGAHKQYDYKILEINLHRYLIAMSYEKATTPALLYHSPGAKSINLPGNPVYSVSREEVCGAGWLISSVSIRFEDIAKLGNLHLAPGQDVPEVIRGIKADGGQ
jgi:hypothetical protein